MANEPAPFTELIRCADCGLEWFANASPGDTAFYNELTAVPRYYTAKWEFGPASARIRMEDTVVDLGCGSGAFLNLIRPVTRRAVGVDRSVPGVAAVRAANGEAYDMEFAEFADNHPSEFTVVTCFQVVEHLASVMDAVAPAVKLLAPGGRLLLSVPDRDRYGRSRAEPLDSPPHHVSRWSVAQMGLLAESSGLRLVRVDREPISFSVACEYVKDRLSWLGPTGARGARKLIMPERRYQRLASYFSRRGLVGHSLLAEMHRG